MIKRKLYEEKEKKQVEHTRHKPKKVKRSLDVVRLTDACVDGKIVCPIGTEIVIKRYRDGKDRLIIHTLKKIDEDGLVHMWDEEADRWFILSLKEKLPDVFKIYTIPARQEEK